MTTRHALVRTSLSLLCALCAIATFASTARADGAEGAGDVARPWTVEAQCAGGRGLMVATYHGTHVTLSTGWVTFECEGRWTATINYRVGAPSAEVLLDGDTPAAEVARQVSAADGQLDTAKEWSLHVDCTGGDASATLYYGNQVVQTNEIDCHGLTFTWTIRF